MELQVSIEDNKSDLFLNILKEFGNIVREFKILQPSLNSDIKEVEIDEKIEILNILQNISKEDNEIDESFTTKVSI